VSIVEVIDGDLLRFNCSVGYADYFGYLTPHYNWTVLTLDNDDEQRSAQITAGDSAGVVFVTARWPTVPQLHCSVYFDRSDQSASYSDVAWNAPSYREGCTTDIIQVQSPPRDVRVNDTSVSGQRRLHCSATGRPTPSYEWHHVSDDDQPFVVGDSLVLTDPGRHKVRCVAANIIRGVRRTLASDVVVVKVLPQRDDTDSVTDYGPQNDLNDSSRRRHATLVSSVDETITQISSTAYNDDAVLGGLINSPFFIPGTSAVAIVLLFLAVSLVVVCCRRRKNQRQLLQVPDSMGLASMVSPNIQQNGQNGEERDVVDGDERASAVYDEIVHNPGSTQQPFFAASEQYDKLITSDVTPAVASGTGVDVYRPLQHDSLTKITIAVGKCDVSIVFNGDGGVTGSIQPAHAHSSASLQHS